MLAHLIITIAAGLIVGAALGGVWHAHRTVRDIPPTTITDPPTRRSVDPEA